MGPVHDVALLSVGAWLFLYRIVLWTGRCSRLGEVLTTVCCGLSVSLLAPLLPWPPPGFRAVSLALLGVLFAFCHPAFTATLVTIPLGVGLASLVWQLGLCSIIPTAHAIFLSVVSVVLVGVFVCAPGIAGIASLHLVLVPSLSALLLTTAIAGLAPSLGTLEPQALLQAAPCAAEGGDVRAPLLSLACWLVLAACAVGLQLFFAWRARKMGRRAGGRGDLVASLLPGSTEDPEDDDGEEGFKKPDGMQNDRFQMLIRAIYADKDADLSHLTENERKIVEVCREDEFERDRLIWGGGLI